MHLRLMVLDQRPEAKTSENFKYEKDYCLIGREHCDLQLNDSRCSRQHAMLFENPDHQLVIKDLNSRNGTRVRGINVSETTLSVGEEFRIGKLTVVIVEFKPAHLAKLVEKSLPVETEPQDEVTSTQTGVILHGSESLYKCLPDEAKAQFIDYVDDHGTQTRIRLKDLIKNK